MRWESAGMEGREQVVRGGEGYKCKVVAVSSLYNLNIQRMVHRIWSVGSVLLALASVCAAINSSLPIWVSSSYFKAGGVSFSLAAGATTQNLTITYSTAMVNATLKVPVLGITDLNYKILAGRVQLLIEMVKYTVSYCTFNITVNANSNLLALKITYMALDNSFQPAYSMNYYFPFANKTGPNLSYQAYINFTQSTGVLLNTSHQNVLLPFLHYIDVTTRDGTVDINLNFSLLNSSYYTVIITSTSNMTLNYAGFSRMIFDKTAIEALGSDYFNYGIVYSTNNNATALSTTIPPDIIPSNLFYGLHSFNIQTSLSQLNFISSYTTTSGFIGFTPQGTYLYSQMKFSYMHHKTRICPGTNPYYNISELLCYDVCAAAWYGDNPTMTCKKCPYNCVTCSSATVCTNCDASSNRQLNSTACTPLPGYYDDGSSTAAKPCASSCSTCSGSATNCLSCGSGYYNSSFSCISCNSAISGCLSCSNSSYCNQCSGGGSGPFCTNCATNQYVSLVDGSCQSCAVAMSNCQSCISSTQCTICQSTFTLSSGSCGCTAAQYQAGGSCSSCSAAISYCASCTSASACTTCASTFTLFSATNCGCTTGTYLNSTSSQCVSCTVISQYCQSCNSSGCSVCPTTFEVSGGKCVCARGSYANSTDQQCESCSVIANCVRCVSVSNCSACTTGYKVNTSSWGCIVQTCLVDNCDTCVGNTTNLCLGCNAGYSLAGNNSCLNYCGNMVLDQSQECDDGNQVSGDGCSSACKVESGFSCPLQQVNFTNAYSSCFYSSPLTFSLVWTRKFEGNNSLKFQFQLEQQLGQWSSVDFSNAVAIDQYDKTTNLSLNLSQSFVQSYTVEYVPSSNRFWVILNYVNSSLQKSNLQFSLTPYSHSLDPAFSPPNNAYFIAPLIQTFTTVTANNNQNANLYTPQEYGLYSASVVFSYILMALAFLALITCLAFRTAKIIVVEMITVLQLSYFSLAFLDSMSPAFSGLLPLRFLAGILNFRDVQSYLEELSSPNCMKGIYMYLNLSNNLSWAALILGLFLLAGLLLMLAYIIYDFLANPETLQNLNKREQQKNGFWLYQLSFNVLGELSLALILFFLPLYSISFFFEMFYTTGNFNFWSYAEAFGIGMTFLGYSVALLKSHPPKDGSSGSRLGEFISQFNCAGCFKTFKYGNLQMVETFLIAGLVMATIYANGKIFSALCVILLAVMDIVLVAVIKPYRYGFVSCFKGQDNQTQAVFQKIELYKVYEKPQPSILRIEQPDTTQKSDLNEYTGENFTQHFATKQNVLKTKHQGLVQEGEVLNHTKLFLFNNNTRRIVNLSTLVVVQFFFICAQIYAGDINQSYPGVTIQNMYPLLIHLLLLANVGYNYTMMVLQIVDHRKQSLGRVVAEPEDATLHLSKSLYNHTIKDKIKEDPMEPSHDTNSSFINSKEIFEVNKLIIQSNATEDSVYNHKRPHLNKTAIKQVKKHRRNIANIDEEVPNVQEEVTVPLPQPQLQQ